MYIISGYLLYFGMFVIGFICLHYLVTTRKGRNNYAYWLTLGLLAVSLVMLFIDMIRWQLIGYVEEVTIYDTLGPILYYGGILMVICNKP